MTTPCLLLILILVCALPSSGQVQYGSLELTSKNLKTLQRFLIGDTIVLFYRDPYSSNRSQPFLNEHLVFITADGGVQKRLIPELYGKEKIAVIRNGDNLLFYFAEEIRKKETILKVLIYNSQTNERVVTTCCVIPDNLLAATADKALTFVYSDASDELSLMRVDAGKVTENVQYRLPPNTIDAKAGVAFIDEDTHITIAQAFQPVKIYHSNGQIVITHDKIYYDVNIKKNGTYCTIINTNSREVISMTVPEPGKTLFTSFWNDGRLYRIIKDNGFHVRIFEGEKEMHRFSIPCDINYADSTGVVRDDVNHRVFTNRTVGDIMDNYGKPFISVQAIDSINIQLKIGTQKQVSHGHTQVIPVTSFTGLLVSLIASSISHAIMDESHVYRYFYLRGNVSDGFTYANETRMPEQRIDQYERFDRKTKTDYRHKSYLRNKHQTIALYVRKKSHKLELVRFE